MGCRTLAGNASWLLMVPENLCVKIVGYVRIYRGFFCGFSSAQKKKIRKEELLLKQKKNPGTNFNHI